MKIRLRILTENNVPRPKNMTEAEVKKAWQAVFGLLGMMSENDDKCTVESVEFVEDGDGK